MLDINNMQRTTIALSKEVRNKLASLGTKDSTFDDIVSRLIRSASNMEGLQKHGK